MNNKKKKYENPLLSIISIHNSDIIVTSCTHVGCLPRYGSQIDVYNDQVDVD